MFCWRFDNIWWWELPCALKDTHNNIPGLCPLDSRSTLSWGATTKSIPRHCQMNVPWEGKSPSAESHCGGQGSAWLIFLGFSRTAGLGDLHWTGKRETARSRWGWRSVGTSCSWRARGTCMVSAKQRRAWLGLVGCVQSRRQGRGGKAQGPLGTPAPCWDYLVKEKLGNCKLSPSLVTRVWDGLGLGFGKSRKTKQRPHGRKFPKEDEARSFWKGLYTCWAANHFRGSLERVPFLTRPGTKEIGRRREEAALTIPGPHCTVEKLGIRGAWWIQQVLLCNGYLKKFISVQMLGATTITAVNM